MNAYWKFNWQIESKPRDTPQHNHMAELSIAKITNKGRALLISANVTLKY